MTQLLDMPKALQKLQIVYRWSYDKIQNCLLYQPNGLTVLSSPIYKNTYTGLFPKKNRAMVFATPITTLIIYSVQYSESVIRKSLVDKIKQWEEKRRWRKKVEKKETKDKKWGKRIKKEEKDKNKK